MNILGAIKSDNNRIIRYTKIGVLFVCVLLYTLGALGNDNYAVAEDGVITTHIWATDYDSTKHWEYCTLCGTVRNEITHVFKDNWFKGVEDCSDGNYSIRICDCGYNYQYYKPHGARTEIKPHGCKTKHYNTCVDCGAWMVADRCYNDKGFLSCKNPGTCNLCGYYCSPHNHFITGGGLCRDCGEAIVEFTTPTVTYDEGYRTATINFKMWTTRSDRVLTGLMNNYNSVKNYSSKTWTYKDLGNGVFEYTGVYVFDSTRQHRMVLCLGDVSPGVRENGVAIFIETGFTKVHIWQDHEKPVVTEIIQEEQKTYGDWATIKKLTIKGTDDLTSIVKISILDKETGEVVVDSAKAPVINGNFTYTCTPPLEGPATGREYICKVEDEVGNILERDFTIYKTDSKPPTLASNDTYTEWSRQKEILFNITDNGAGGVRTSLVDQVSYKSILKDGDNYYAEYHFDEENYGATSYNLYLKDGLGNATKTVVTVGKIDLTKPTIENTLAKKENNMVVATIKANDFSKRMGAEGSGPNMYAITETPVVPTEGQWQKSNEVKAYNPGRYYLWVKDLAGNIGDAAVLDVDPKLNPDIDPNDKIIYDSGVKEDDSIVKDNNEKTDSIKNNTVDKLNGDLSRYDDTPKTGDYNYLVLYIILMISSGFMMIVINVCSRRKVQKTNIHK